jgi:hypothetical protein
MVTVDLSVNAVHTGILFFLMKLNNLISLKNSDDRLHGRHWTGICGGIGGQKGHSTALPDWPKSHESV